MNDREIVRSEAIQRVGEFGALNAADWTPAQPGSPQARIVQKFELLNAEKTGIVARLKAFATGQKTGDAAFHGGTTSKSVLRDAVLADLRALNRTAAGAATDQERPELMEHFRMPYGLRDEQFATAARAMQKAGVEQEALLLSYGLEAGLLAKLGERVGEFEQANQNKGSGLQSRVAAGEGLDDTLDVGLRILRTLKALLGNLYQRQPDKFAAWQSACRIHRTGSRPASPSRETPNGQPGNG